MEGVDSHAFKSFSVGEDMKRRADNFLSRERVGY